jgi:toxin ParE1/3/4
VKAVRYSQAAKADLAKIWRYSAETWGAVQANSYARKLQDASSGVSTGRRIGHKSSAQDGMFKIRCGSHMIYYRMTSEHVEIIRILHGKQDVERHL